MKTIRHILLLIAFLSLLPCGAQHEIEIDWSAYAQDTVMPMFVHSVDLGYDCVGAYSATIEYPELKQLTPAEVERLRLPQTGGAPALEVGGASRDPTGFGALEEGLISS